jgi:hypothetical protein
MQGSSVLNPLSPLGKGLLVLLGLALQSACSTTPPEIHRLNVAPADPSNKQNQLTLSTPSVDVLLYGVDGHFYTAGYVAYLAGYRDPSKLKNISCYTQTPDELLWSLNAVPVAFYGIVPGLWSYRHQVLDGLHSLHGGDVGGVEIRRARLKQKIVEAVAPGSKVPDWQLGFLIHAFGDSYAHVHGTPARAYSQRIGHAIPSLTGDNPDAIFVNRHYQNYNAYVRSLYEALSQDETPAKADFEGLELFTDEITKEAAKGDDPNKTVIINIRHGLPTYVFRADEQVCKEMNVKIDKSEIREFLRKLSSDLDS